MENEIKDRQAKLEQSLANKERELQELEAQINKLKSELTEKSGNTDDLLQYYLNKYDGYYDEIVGERKKDNETNKIKLEKEIKELTLLQKEAAEILKSNEQHQKKIAKLVRDETDAVEKLAQEEDKINKAIDQFILDINEINFDADQRYLNLLTEFNDAINKRMTFEDFFNCLDNYQTYLDSSGFEKATEIKNQQQELKAYKASVSEGIDALRSKIAAIQTEKKSEEAKLVDTNLFDLEDQLFIKKDDMANFDTQREKVVNKFINLKERHHNNFKDILYKLNLYHYTAAEIGKEFEKLLDLFVQELNMVDSDEQDFELRQKEIALLKERITLVEKAQVELPILEEELATMQQTYSSAHEEITEMERYIAKCNPLIKPDSRYYDWYLSFKAIKEKLDRLIDEKKDQTNKISLLYKERKKLVHNPFAKNNLKGLDEKILSEEAALQALLTSIDDNMVVWKAIDNNPEQARFKSIMAQKNKFEDRLPILYQSLNELKQVIDEKFDKVTDMKAKVLTLDRLYEEIGNLENENND